MDVAEASVEAKGFMVRLADRLAGHFPYHAQALREQFLGTRLTDERWNRMAAVLAGLSAVPGAPLTADEHMTRALGLRAVVVGQKMAQARIGYKGDPEGTADFAIWLAREITNDMESK